MSYVQGEDRGQAALLPAAIDDYVAADAPSGQKNGSRFETVTPPPRALSRRRDLRSRRQRGNTTIPDMIRHHRLLSK
jgi:hypothetical protein